MIKAALPSILVSLLLVSGQSANDYAEYCKYLQVADQAPSDRTVDFSTDDVVLIHHQLELPEDTWVLFHSDGSFTPNEACMASAHVEVNNATVTNRSVVDWYYSLQPEVHSFNAIGLEYLEAGSYSVDLIAEYIDGSYTVSTDSNLSIFVNPSSVAGSDTLSSTEYSIHFDTTGINDGILLRPALTRKVLGADIEAPEEGAPVVVLASGSSYLNSVNGDAMWGVFPQNVNDMYCNQTLWGINDIYYGAELEAPMYVHGLFNAESNSTETYELHATVYPLNTEYPNGVEYNLNKSAKLIALAGPFSVVGAGVTGNSTAVNTYYNHYPIAFGDEAIPSQHADLATKTRNADDYVLLTESSFTQTSSDPPILFVAKARVQADSMNNADWHADVEMRITIDGDEEYKGSIGRQGIDGFYSQCQRTISASYFAAGEEALSAGPHIVKVWAKANTNNNHYYHVGTYEDACLIYFD